MGNPNTMDELMAIFANHAQERICVVGTTCCGKTTLLKQISDCIDMDEVLFSNITKEEAAFVCQTPWTKEIGDEFTRLTYERVRIKPGCPVFGTVIVDCEVVVCLEIDDTLLEERCRKRNVTFEDARNMREAIQGDIDNHKASENKLFYHVKML